MKNISICGACMQCQCYLKMDCLFIVTISTLDFHMMLDNKKCELIGAFGPVQWPELLPP